MNFPFSFSLRLSYLGIVFAIQFLLMWLRISILLPMVMLLISILLPVLTFPNIHISNPSWWWWFPIAFVWKTTTIFNFVFEWDWKVARSMWLTFGSTSKCVFDSLKLHCNRHLISTYFLWFMTIFKTSLICISSIFTTVVYFL